MARRFTIARRAVPEACCWSPFILGPFLARPMTTANEATSNLTSANPTIGRDARRRRHTRQTITWRRLSAGRVFASPNRKCTPLASHQAISSSRAKPESARSRVFCPFRRWPRTRPSAPRARSLNSARSRMRTSGQRRRIWATMRATKPAFPHGSGSAASRALSAPDMSLTHLRSVTLSTRSAARVSSACRRFRSASSWTAGPSRR